MPSPFSSFFRILRLAAVLAAAALAAPVFAADVSASASFKPAQLAVGQTGLYLLDLHGTSGTPQGNVPDVPGLKMQFAGRQTQVQINNGAFSSTLTYQFQVQPEKSGTFSVPSFIVNVDGQSITVPSASLTVTDQPALPPAGSGNQPLSLSANVATTQVYVGEKLPLDLTLSSRDDLRLMGINGFTQTGDSFDQIQDALRVEPERDTVQQDDHSYDTFTWHAAITPLKSGAQALSFSMPVTVMRMDGGMDQLDEQMARVFGNAGVGFGQQQQLTVDSAPLTFDVQPLPADGRPANFTGGIGLFDLNDPTLSSSSLQVGVPVTLTLTVSGKGNFDRIQAPVLDTGALWRSYKPKETFQPDPNDPTGYHGTKTFEYVLMPLSQNVTEVPPPQFNFFNPDTKTYVDLTPKPIPVTVQPAPPGQSVPLPPVTNNVAAAAPTLVGPRTEPGTWVSPSLRPIFFSPYFLGAQAVPAVLLTTLIITRRRRLRLETDPAYARRLRAQRTALAAAAKARAAAAAGQAAEFYIQAQHALQEAASHSVKWREDTSAEALTWPEFDAHLTACNVPAEAHAAAREIFEAGDALRFGGFTPDQADLTNAANRLDGLVRQLLRA